MSTVKTPWRTIRRTDDDTVILARAKWCSSFWCKFRGLMLRPPLPPGEGLLFVHQRESKVETTIHMLFMRFPIAVIWIDAAGKVVDKTLAKPWRLAYAPQAPAQYFIEAGAELLDRVAIGDTLRFDDAAD